VWFVLICAVPVTAVGALQYAGGPGVYASLGEGFANGTFVTVGTVSGNLVFRPNATFSWSSHFASFLALATLLCVGLLLESRGWRRLLLVGFLAGMVAANVLEGQRTLYVLLPPLIVLTVVLQRGWGWIPIVAVAMVGGVAIVAQFAGSAAFERVLELSQNQDAVIQSRLEGAGIYLNESFAGGVFGLGSGATALGTRYVSGGDIPLFVEFGIAKVAGELGTVGLLVFLWMFGSLMVRTVLAQRRALRVSSRAWGAVLASIVAFQVCVIPGGYDLAIVALPLWFLSGATSVGLDPKPADTAHR
jgi:hypothetical protein